MIDSSKYQINEATGCWNWLGALNDWGYAKFYIDGKAVKAHKYMYEQKHNIKISDDLHHTCDNKRCVNPDHLEPKEHSQHVREHNETITLDQVSTIRIRAANKESYTKIARTMGISLPIVKGAAYGHTYKNCLTSAVPKNRRVKITQETKDLVLSMAKNKNKSQAEIASVVGISQVSVYHILQEG